MSRHLLRIRTTLLHPLALGLMLGLLANIFSPAYAQTSGAAVRILWRHVEVPNHWNQDALPISIKAMCVDPAGNTFTAAQMGDSSPNAGNAEDCPRYFVVDKYDNSGHRAWRCGNVPMARGLATGDIEADRDGNVYAVEADGGRELLLSYNSQGALRWSFSPVDDGLLWMRPAAMALSNTSQLLVAYYDSYTSDQLLTFDASSGGYTGTSACRWATSWGTRSRVFIAPDGRIHTYGTCAAIYSPEGSLVKSVPLSTVYYDVAEDHHGNSYLLTQNGTDRVLYKRDSNFSPLWQMQTSMNRVLVDSSDNMILIEDAGVSSAHKYAAKIGPDRQVLWVKEWDSRDFDVYACEVDPIGNLYVLVWAESDSTVYLGSYNSDGDLRWFFPVELWDNGYYQFNGTVRWLDRLLLPSEGAPILLADNRGDIHLAGNAYTLDYNSQGDALISEYSLVARYTQAKTLIVRDAHRDPIPNTAFNLIRVHNDPPLLSEDTLGMFETDSSGQFVFPLTGPGDGIEYLFPQSELNPIEDILQVGDTLKIARLVLSKPAIRHPEVLSTQYSVSLDNGRFLDDGRLVFDTVELGSIQTVSLRHTEYRYNLLASLEWDASELYVQGLQRDFRQMSNYLYDVTDGQARLDTVVILDDRSQWDDADIRVTASNVYWPNAGIAGMAFQGFPPITVPRKWFGDPDSCRTFSYLLHPLMDAVSDNYRTMAHELGHYGFAFSDEYLFADPNGNPLPEAVRCQALPSGNYGLMDFQYDRPAGGVWASEMSNEYRYQSVSCRNTLQWVDNRRSCWDDFEHWAQGIRNGIFVPILKPSETDSTERVTPPGMDYFPGPNDNLYALDYDVGRLVLFPGAVVPPAAGTRSIHLKIDPATAGGTGVSLRKMGIGVPRLIDQGMTTDQGKMWILGMDPGQDQILASAATITLTGRAQTSKVKSSARKTWIYGMVQPGSGYSKTGNRATASSNQDSVTLSLKPVHGDYPLVCQASLYDLGWNYALFYNTAFPTYMPTLDIATESGEFVTGNFTSGTDRYGCPVALYLTKSGQATVWAVDDSLQAYFFNTPFKVFDISSPRELTKLTGPSGEAVVRVDSINSAIQRAMILSSPYPPLMNGLGNGAVQAGQTHSLSTYPSESYFGADAISIKYRDSDLQDANGAWIGDETALRVFRWNPEAARWDLVGGIVDATLNTVTAVIDKSGTYGVFTMTGSCCRGKTGNIDGDPLDLVDISDVMRLLDYLFFQGSVSDCATENDVNKDTTVDISDLMLLLDYLFFEGPLPECP